jgi:hypothetical protein
VSFSMFTCSSACFLSLHCDVSSYASFSFLHFSVLQWHVNYCVCVLLFCLVLAAAVAMQLQTAHDITLQLGRTAAETACDGPMIRRAVLVFCACLAALLHAIGKWNAVQAHTCACSGHKVTLVTTFRAL